MPLAVAVQRLYRNEAVVRLEREAARAGAQVPTTFRTSGDPVELPASDDGTQLGVYAPDGQRLLGAGPHQGGDEVARAAAGKIAESAHGTLVVASPLTADEHVFAVVRAELPVGATADRVHRAWLLMGALGALLLLAAVFVGRVLSGRIAKPVADLALASARLGNGDFTARAGRSGIAELDAAAANLDVTAERLGRLIGRERAFSADASHQLRTPLTGLRLHLETALASPTVDSHAAMTVALGEVDRLERTIDDLLALARDAYASRGPFDIHAVIDELERAWHGRLAARGRPLRVDADTSADTACASPGAVQQILEVLITNAAEHGSGTIRVQTHLVSRGVAIDVSDEGPGIRGDPDEIFERRSGRAAGHGIGLALARSLAEAEDARLLLVNAGPNPTFRLVLRHGDSPP
ncbi:MAG: HAMP domain-containing histidine kinase [Actinomycetota bacterium]|nr:HAMP domain-containing histidine kinase [Actinomycetota bacterium]